MLVVAFIITLLASSALAFLGDARSKARDARRMADMNQIQLAVYFHYDDYDFYPVTGASLTPTADGWIILEAALASGERPYMMEFAHDPRGDAPYQYKYASNGDEYVIEYTSEGNGVRTLRGW